MHVSAEPAAAENVAKLYETLQITKCSRHVRGIGVCLSRALSLMIGFMCVATILGFLARWWFPFEYLCHFRVQYAFVLVLGLVAATVKKRYWTAATYASLASVNACLILPLYIEAPSASRHSQTIEQIRLLSLNVKAKSSEHAEVLGFVRENNPDLIVLLEMTPSWMRAMAPLADEYPYVVHAGTDTDNGVLVGSKFPFVDTDVKSIQGRMAVVAQVNIDGRTLTFIGAHTFPPKTKKTIDGRNRQLAALASIAKSSVGAVVLAGDLNTSSWSPDFNALIDRSNLRDSRKGFGVQATWPARLPVVQVPIDHCLVSRSIVVHDRKVGRYVGSDHYPIVVDFSILDPRPRLRTRSLASDSR